MILYADANGYYSVEEAIRVGRLLEEYDYRFFEEPVHFDWYEETKQVADALSIAVAGGEQEYSLHGFRRLIAKARRRGQVALVAGRHAEGAGSDNLTSRRGVQDGDSAKWLMGMGW